MYLGYVISKDGSNMPNISHKTNKSIGTQKKIVKLVEPLALALETGSIPARFQVQRQVLNLLQYILQEPSK